MIKATDLRIGNLVTIHNTLREENGYCHEITEIRQIDCQVKLLNMDIIYGQMYKFIKPIPLTESWLIKLGFKYYKPLNQYEIEMDDVVFQVSKHKDGSFWFTFVNLGVCEKNHMPLKRIDSIHQLQNLFYALTGTELKLNK